MAMSNNWLDLECGLMIHYGLYSIPGGVWKGKNITRGYSEQILSHGKLDKREYEALQKEFTAEAFDADYIASLAVKAGMKYIVMTAKHHDGFCLFNTRTTDYHSERDLIKEMADSSGIHNLAFGIYFSWIDWHTPYALPISDHNSDRIPEEHQRLNIAQLTELLSNYGDIAELWMDMGAPTEEQSREVRSLAKRLQPDIMINSRVWNGAEDFVEMGDNQIPDKLPDLPFETPASVYHETWGYRAWQDRSNMEERKKAILEGRDRVIRMGGNYLLNIGPKGDGSLVPEEVDVLEFLSGHPIPQRNKPIYTEVTEEKKQIKGHNLYHYRGSDYYSFKPVLSKVIFYLESKEGCADISIKNKGYFLIDNRKYSTDERIPMHSVLNELVFIPEEDEGEFVLEIALCNS